MNLQFPQNSSNTQSFTARAPQVRDAQWVCRKVRSFPHISTTRISAKMWDLKEQNWNLYDRFTSTKPFEHFFPKNEHEFKITKLFAWQKRIIKRITYAREDWRVGAKDDYRKVSNIMGQLKYDKIGNCGEDAFLSAAITKINGVNNVCTAKMKIDNSPIDHIVCVFNADDSVFNGKIKKDTIIIDSWINQADFASNMFVKYKNLCQKFFFNLKPNSEIGFREITPIKLSGEEKLVLSLKYDKLRYPSVTRSFMQKK